MITRVDGGAKRFGPIVCLKGSPEPIEKSMNDEEVLVMYTETAKKFARGGMRVLELSKIMWPVI